MEVGIPGGAPCIGVEEMKSKGMMGTRFSRQSTGERKANKRERSLAGDQQRLNIQISA